MTQTTETTAPTSRRDESSETLATKIEAIRAEHSTWGYRRISAYLISIGWSDGTEYAVRREMRIAEEATR
jgi:hypothetical protein